MPLINKTCMSKAFMSRFIYKRFPQFISVVFHPLLMPTIGVYIILHSGTYISFMRPEAKNIILLIVLSCTFGLPLAFVPLFYYRKITTSLDLSNNTERIIPLIITALLYYFSFYLLRRMGVPGLIQSFLLASAIAVCTNLFITTRWKISAHMIGIGGLTGLIISLAIFYSANIMLYFLAVIVLSGLIGFARLSLNAHSPAQVYLGLGIGFIVMLLTVCLF